MSASSGPVGPILDALQERAKELHTLYRVHEICARLDASLEEIYHDVVDVIPGGFQHPAGCWARLVLPNGVWEPVNRTPSADVLTAPISVQGEVLGHIDVFYEQGHPAADEGPFLREERRLLDTIAGRLGQLLLHRRLLAALQHIGGARGPSRRSGSASGG